MRRALATESARVRSARLACACGATSLDWEYPVCCGEAANTYDPADWSNFVVLLHEMRAALDAAFPATHKELSIAVGMSEAVTGAAPKSAIGDVVDAVNLMTYDYNGAWAMLTAHNAPLYSDPAYEAAGGSAQANIAWGVGQWLAHVNASKLVLGMPAYGRSWRGTTQQYGQGTGVGPGTWEAGGLSYWDIAANYLPSSTRHWNAASRVPYLTRAAQGARPALFATYDDDESIAIKAEFARGLGLGGMVPVTSSNRRVGG